MALQVEVDEVHVVFAIVDSFIGDFKVRDTVASLKI